MICIDEISQAVSLVQAWRKKGLRIGLVPTMGFLHEGHLALMRKSSELSDRTVATIFVNPRQFGPKEDFEKYPRNLAHDTQKAEEAGVDMLFCPSVAAMYPKNFQTNIRVNMLSQGLCGSSRPGHFDGVATVVLKLFNIIVPDLAIFGKKDYQQLALIKQMTIDLNLDVEIIGHDIVRENDGLAMSSRNKYLSDKERHEALCLSQALKLAATRVTEGKKVNAAELISELQVFLHQTESCKIDYIDIVDSITLEKKKIAQAGDLLAVAAYFNNKVRLIDNIEL